MLALGSLRQLDPFLSDPEPCFLIQRAESFGPVISGFVRLPAEPCGII
jgi:hypothetical protein